MKQSVNFCDLKCFISLMKHILVSTQTPLKYYVKVCKDVSDVAKHLANTLLLCCCYVAVYPRISSPFSGLRHKKCEVLIISPFAFQVGQSAEGMIDLEMGVSLSSSIYSRNKRFVY